MACAFVVSMTFVAIDWTVLMKLETTSNVHVAMVGKLIDLDIVVCFDLLFMLMLIMVVVVLLLFSSKLQECVLMINFMLTKAQ